MEVHLDGGEGGTTQYRVHAHSSIPGIEDASKKAEVTRNLTSTSANTIVPLLCVPSVFFHNNPLLRYF